MKAAKAQYYARNHGLVYGKMLIACPLNWQSEDRMGNKIVQVEQAKIRITYDPEQKGKKLPVTEWLKLMGKSRHLLKPENAELLSAFQAEVDRRWRRLKAKHEHPEL